MMIKKILGGLVGIGIFVGSVSVSEAKIHGPFKGLHPILKQRLLHLHRYFGRDIHITPNGGCRKRGNKLAPRSYHRISVGCKAADIVIRGVSKRKILNYWRRRFGGGTGYYCGRPFVHVDIGPTRSWTWFCGGRKKRKIYRVKKSRKTRVVRAKRNWK